jgi:preprotein translocase subunit SecG
MLEILETPITVLHVVVCLFVVLIVLLQPGKSGGIGAALGGAGAQQVFGGRGAGNFLSRLTWISAGVFFATSMILAYVSSSTEDSLANKSGIAVVKPVQQEPADENSAEQQNDAPSEPGEETESNLELGEAAAGADEADSPPTGGGDEAAESSRDEAEQNAPADEAAPEVPKAHVGDAKPAAAKPTARAPRAAPPKPPTQPAPTTSPPPVVPQPTAPAPPPVAAPPPAAVPPAPAPAPSH